MKNVDVYVIGGSAAGIVAATTSRNFYPDKRVALIRKEQQMLVPCGIPYMFGTLASSDKNVVPNMGVENCGIDLENVSLIPKEKE